MEAFLIAFGLVGLLIACSVGISLYLYSCGAIGRRGTRGRHLRRVAVQAVMDDDSDDDEYMMDTNVDGTSRYARNGVLFLFSGMVVVGMVLTMLYNVLPH
jgi:hypothetical protein